MKKRLIIAAVVLATAGTAYANLICTVDQYVACQTLCASATPPTCGLYNVECTINVEPTCECDYVCSISPHGGGNNIKHLELIMDENNP